MMREKIGGRTKCDFSGEEIKCMEPRFRIRLLSTNEKEGIHSFMEVKKNSIQELISNFENSYYKINNKDCYFSCGHSRSKKVVNTISSSIDHPQESIELCNTCINNLKTRCEEVQKIIKNDIVYWSNKGVCVRRPRLEVNTVFEGNNLTDSFALLLGYKEKVHVDLGKANYLNKAIQKPIEKMISEPSIWVNGFRPLNSPKCFVCDEYVIDEEENFYSISGWECIHKKCTDELVEEIEYICDEFSDLILPRMI